MTPQRIRRLLFQSSLIQRCTLLLLGCIAAADAYLRFQIASETVEKLIIRFRRGEEINVFGDRVWNIIFPVSSLLIILLLWRSPVRSFPRSVDFEVAEN